MKSFKSSINDCDYIELDVQASKDNEPIIFYDMTLKRICGINKKVSDMTSKEIQSKTILSSNQYIPTLRTVLENINHPLLIELKNEKIVNKTVKLCNKYNNKIIYQSFNRNIIKNISSKNKKMILVPSKKYIYKKGIPSNSITSIKKAMKFIDKINITGMCIHHSKLSKLRKLYKRNKLNKKYRTYTWTVRSKKQYTKINKHKYIDGVITDSSEFIN